MVGVGYNNPREVFVPAKPLSKRFSKGILEKYIALAEGYRPRDKDVFIFFPLRTGRLSCSMMMEKVLAYAQNDILVKEVCGRQDL
ncbi:MAG: hypothetical protein QXR26_04860 [Candidatus Caldarchaeum sp.]